MLRGSALGAWPERVGFMVGGALSRNEHAWMLRREVPEALALDERVLEAITRGDWSGLTDADREQADKAHPEAGLRHLEMLRGFLGDDVKGEVRCYESGPGVGAALIELPLGTPPETPAPRPAREPKKTRA